MIGIVTAAVIVAALIWILLAGQYRQLGGQAVNGPAGATGVATRTAVPSNVVVPNATTTGITANIAIPSAVAPGDSTGSTSLRSFSVKIANNAFSPSEIVVYDGDTVSISFTAVDKAYDWTLPDYGMQVAVPQGATKQVQLSPHGTGKFLFYCTQCGGPKSGPTGYLVVVARQ